VIEHKRESDAWKKAHHFCSIWTVEGYSPLQADIQQAGVTKELLNMVI